MSDANDVQALENISNAVDDSQINIIWSTQCIKAQTFLVSKLRKQTQQQKEICNYINKSNSKLETEIRIAHQQIQSMITTLETIRTSNIDLQKEFLLAKERKCDIIKRVGNGIKKYEDIWQNSKTKYENIPFIKDYLKTKNDINIIKGNINVLKVEYQKILYEIGEKRNNLADLDKKRILELANYLIIERPKTLLSIEQKYIIINQIKKDIKKTLQYNNDTIAAYKVNKHPSMTKEEFNVYNKQTKDGNTNSNKNIEADAMLALPKLELCYIDLDVLTEKLDKIKKADSNIEYIKEIEISSESTHSKAYKFYKDVNVILNDDDTNISNKPNIFSERKLINILDDIKLNNNEVKDILAKVNQSELINVDVNANFTTSNIIKNSDVSEDKDVKITEVKNEEEPDNRANSLSLIIPPTQFVDVTDSQKGENIGEEKNARANVEMDNEITDVNKMNEEDNLNNNITDINNSGASDSSYDNIKDTVLKKHKLDLSPQFVYSKKPMTRMKPEETISSKFFIRKPILNVDDKKNNAENDLVQCSNENRLREEPDKVDGTNPPKDASSLEQKSQLIVEERFAQKDKPVAGLLFNHGPGEIIPSLDTSLSTTGLEDGDNDFPHCLDSSLLLSPKADLEIQDSNATDVEVISQDVPNFLSGLRKTGLSFFGTPHLTDRSGTSIINKNPQQGSNFNFTFGGEEKKNRGGLFSMFR